MLFWPINGVGIGHVVRTLAIARRMEHAAEPVFATDCQALAIVEEQGFPCEFIPHHTYTESDVAKWIGVANCELNAIVDHYRPAALVFDGHTPSSALVRATARRPIPRVWVRRGMWRDLRFIDRVRATSRLFDLVIEPHDIAGHLDAGATAHAGDDARKVSPILFLDDHELLSRTEARDRLQVAPERQLCLIQLGAGSNRDIERLVSLVLRHLRQRPDVDPVLVDWPIKGKSTIGRDCRTLTGFPVSRILKGVDFAISAAGYNSFHEAMFHGVPTIFLPNDHPAMDDQRARAAFAEGRGAAITVPPGLEEQVGAYIDFMLDAANRQELGRNAKAIFPVNGAAEAAELVLTSLREF